MLLGSNTLSGKNSKVFSSIIIKETLVKNLLIFTFIFIVRMFCKYIIFLGTINIFIIIITMCFLSTIILCLNYNNKYNKLYPNIVKLIYTPLVLFIFIISGISLDVLFNIITFCILISIYLDLPFLCSTGLNNPGSNIPGGSQGSSGLGGSGGVGGSGGNNNGSSLVVPIPNDEQVHGGRRNIALKYDKVNERYHSVQQHYNNTGTKREFLNEFIVAYNRLNGEASSLNYNDLAILKKGFVDYNHLLSPNVKQNLYGLAEPSDLRRESGYGLQTSTLMKNSVSIAFEAHRIMLQIHQEI